VRASLGGASNLPHLSVGIDPLKGQRFGGICDNDWIRGREKGREKTPVRGGERSRACRNAHCDETLARMHSREQRPGRTDTRLTRRGAIATTVGAMAVLQWPGATQARARRRQTRRSRPSRRLPADVAVVGAGLAGLTAVSERRWRKLALWLALPIGMLVTTPPASADQTFSAVFHDRFEADAVTITQGDSLTFGNVDTDIHNLVAQQLGSDGRPLFSTPNVTPESTHAVDGVTLVPAGSYAFECTVHPFMQGTLIVTANGGQSESSSSPGGSESLSLRLVSSRLKDVRRTGRLLVSGTSAAGGQISVVARIGKTLAAQGAATLKAGSHFVTLRMTRAGRKNLARHRRVRLLVAGTLVGGGRTQRPSTRGKLAG
jgi:plastocyanin